MISRSCTRSSATGALIPRHSATSALLGFFSSSRASADHHGNVRRAHLKALEQRLGVGIVLDVDIYVGPGITRQELP